MKTLIVEDDFASRLILQKMLSPYGEAHVAVNGNEAVQAFQAALEAGQPYQLLCLDIMLPELDGQEALRRIRGIEETKGVLSSEGVKIVMVTALGDMKNVMGAFSSLCDGYLTKPIRRADLIQFLEQHQLVPPTAPA